LHPKEIVMAASEPLPLASQLCFAVYSANIAINRAYRPLLDRLGITYPQYLILSALWEQDGQTIGTIADRLALESSTVTPSVKRMEAAGLVTRERNAKDERQVIVKLTVKGAGLREESRCLSQTLLERSGLQVPELVRLNQEVGALRDAIVASGKDA
jgi:MarR family transcriptional regulator, organic hydroperoxide resistance regulator